MKKTTTRLATTLAVLLMSAFAIILAQHDARKNAHSEESAPVYRTPAEPPMPLAINEWPSTDAVVRANNDNEYTDDDSTLTSYDNPLRGASDDANAVDLAAAARDLFPADVVTASGENYALSDPPATGNPSTPAALQPLPTTLPESFPSLSGGSFSGLPSTTPPGAAPPQPSFPSPSTAVSSNRQPVANLPGLPTLPTTAPGSTTGSTANTSQPSTASLGTPSGAVPSLPNENSLPTLPTQPTSAMAPLNNQATATAGLGSSSLPNGWTQNSSSSMSDTQRGAMQPTQLHSHPTAPASSGYNSPFTGNTAGPAELPGGFGSTAAVANNNSFPQTGGDTLPSSTGGASAFASSGSPAAEMANQGPGRMASSSSVFGTTNNAQFGTDNLVSNQPGSRFLDGSQNPVMLIHKRAPEEITVGKKTNFVITVRNAGNATAHEVTVVDRIPRGVRFVEASPNVSPTADGLLVWKLGEMGAGDEKTINLQVVPEIEGEVGSVASVHFAAQASVRTVATAPQIDLQVDAGAPVIIGQAQQIAITIRNSGTGVAHAIRLEADIPAQLKYENGETQLETPAFDLRPNETRRLTLEVAAVLPGQSNCPLRVVNEDGVQAENQFAVDVRAPQLVATVSGPARRYLDRQATYQIVVNNSGTAVARNLYFDVYLPVGLKFVSADIAQATYHPETHSITLGLAELNAGANATFSVTVLPVELGPQNIRFNATGDLGISAEAKGQMTVEGLSELAFTIGQDNGTVEVGATTTYAVQISNVGNQSDKNVQLQVQLPEGAKLLRVDAPVDYREEPGRILFAPIGEMRSRDAKTYRFQVQHNQAGNQVVRAQLTSANWPVAVLKEEGTLVYNDQ